MKKVSGIFRFWSIVAGISSFVLASFLPVSCKMTEDGITIDDADVEAPAIVSFRVESAERVKIVCSKKIEFESLALSKFGSKEPAGEVSVSYDESGASAAILFAQPTLVGSKYVLSGIIKDSRGNTLEFTKPFVGFNANPARLVLSEIRPGSSGNKVEFVEVYALSDGNVSGLSIVSGLYGEKKRYHFPSVEVSKGEYITVHMRTKDTEKDKCINETGSELSRSSATDSSSSRDLWKSTSERYVASKDVLALMKDSDGTLLDAILYSQSGNNEPWKSNVQKAIAKAAVESGVWTGGVEPSENGFADNITNAATSRSLSRQNIAELSKMKEIPDVIPAGPSDWLVVKTVTPGMKNSSEPYVKK
ncbi:hypothetical protein [Treponema zioleckii]|uniref:hypothetical protein n=1 Tax=Treponema zioleckii TaxID=331680 RepID=UPI00168C0BB4|nr:hypothetical protein [Treponema zioleckii]